MITKADNGRQKPTNADNKKIFPRRGAAPAS